MEYDLLHPTPPESLIKDCTAGECVLYAGAGLSARADFPTWQPFLQGLLAWAIENKLIEADSAESSRAAIEQGNGGSVADLIVSTLQNTEASRQGILQDYLRQIFSQSPPLPDTHNILNDIQFCAVLTTNFDNLIERTYQYRSARVYTPKDAEPLLEALHKREFFILKLYGELQRPDTLMISPAQFEDAIEENLPFSQFMDTLFFSRTLLFVGASLEGIDDYLKGIRLKKQRNPRLHYALVAVSEDGWQAKAQLIERRYGIVVIPYALSPDHSQVPEFLEKLAQKITVRTDHETARDSITRLNRVRLENIGPFDNLDLKLDAHWNILLGDNGVGKSGILKAIGIAICGKDAQPYAGRLIKSGRTNAIITLETDRNIYKTELFTTTSGPAELQSIPGRPLEAESWLALGFPPLRTVSWDRPKAPESIARGLPTPEDLLPLVKGEPDPRLDRLKQWIVNLDYRSKHEQSQMGEGGRYEKLLDKFFENVALLTEGVTIERGEVNPNTYEVTVITDDGVIPLEAISQGMTSLIGWMGILLQRLYEIYGEDENPTQRYALVLMDEIDAHLHPAWQRTLVHNLSKMFPNVQFIATTHSALIVAGMPTSQILRFARDDDGKVVQLEIEPGMTMGFADQILTGELFDLPTTLGTTTEEKMVRYQELLGKNSRTSEEEAEYQRLEQSMRFRIPVSGSTRAARQEEVVLEAARLKQVGAKLKSVLPKDSQNLLDEADKLLAALEGEPEA